MSFEPPHVSGNKQMVMNRAYNAVKLCTFCNVGSMTLQLNGNALYHNSSLLSFTSRPFSLLFPILPPISINFCFVSSEPSQIFLLLLTTLSSTPVSDFFPLKNSNDGRAFTVFTSFKTNMWHSAVPAETFDGSVRHSGLSELPALEHFRMLHYTIGQGTRKRMYEIQKKIKRKGERMRGQGASS